MAYAAGLKSEGLCQRCGNRYLRKDLVYEEQTTLYVCKDGCKDEPIRKWRNKPPRINLRWTSPNIPHLTPLFADGGSSAEAADDWPDTGFIG